MNTLQKTRERELDQYLQKVADLKKQLQESEKAIKQARAELDKFYRIVWGPDGDCGSARIIENALEALCFDPNEDSSLLPIGFPTTAPVPVQQVLGAAQGLMDVVVLGWTEDDKEYAASSTSSVAEILLLLERTKIKLLAVDPEDHFKTEVAK